MILVDHECYEFLVLEIFMLGGVHLLNVIIGCSQVHGNARVGQAGTTGCILWIPKQTTDKFLGAKIYSLHDSIILRLLMSPIKQCT